jgi:hypothetical protein
LSTEVLKMAKSGKPGMPDPPKYRQVKLSGLVKGRRGKHHDLVERILQELETVPAGSALEIPLADVEIGLANIRSAVHRGATGKNLEIETLADEKNLYVFKKPRRPKN